MIFDRRTSAPQTWATGLLTIAIPAALLATTCTANASNYVLTSGGQYEVCRQFEKNLQSFGDLPLDLYEWPLNPSLTDFRKPEWRAIDPTEAIPLIEQWARTDPSVLGNQPPGAYLEKQWQKLLADIHAGHARLERTSADIDHRNGPESLFRIQLPFMRYPRSSSANLGWKYFILDALDSNHVGHHLRPWLYDSFFFKNRFFVVSPAWPFDPQSTTAITIAELYRPDLDKGFAYVPVCRFGTAHRSE